MQSRILLRLPLFVTATAVALLVWHGPIPQLAHYHDFADRSFLFGMPHAADVLSNLVFAIVGAWGLSNLWHRRRHPSLAAAWPGYLLFLVALLLTSAGSAFYHLAPDNGRLIWDRLPIALACAGLLAAVRSENVPGVHPVRETMALAAFAILSVLWWSITERMGAGDLRPYLLLQGLPLVLVPLWQHIHRAPRADRQAFGIALALYVLAKAAELHDHELLAALHVASGHTLKHLLAGTAAGVIVGRLAARTRGHSPAACVILAQ